MGKSDPESPRRNGAGWPAMFNNDLKSLGPKWDRIILLVGFVLTGLLIVRMWRPLFENYFLRWDGSRPWYASIDWFLMGLFGFMTLTIMARANLRTDCLIIVIGLVGGLAIESWGTQTLLWTYYTTERPPLWIIPAWPTASLSIDRITRVLEWVAKPCGETIFRFFYWPLMGAFFLLMIVFVAPTFNKPLTWTALILSAIIILTPPNQRLMLLVFLSGSALGYFLEVWGTTRRCWTYYTGDTPPIFAVFAHGMAAMAFWRMGVLVERLVGFGTRLSFKK